MAASAAAPSMAKEKAERPAAPHRSDGFDSLQDGWSELEGGDWGRADHVSAAGAGVEAGASPPAEAQRAQYGNSEVSRVAAATEPAEREAALASKGVLPEAGIRAHPKPLTSPLPAPVQAPLRSAGRPLDASARERMESDLGARFDGVRVHDDADSARSAQSLGARAFTSGRDVVFAKDQYRPGTTEGDSLLRRELTHVEQHARTDEDHLLSADLTPPADTAASPAPAASGSRTGSGSGSAFVGGGGSFGGGGASGSWGGTSALPTTPPRSFSSAGSTGGHFVELKGKPFFEPPPSLEAAIKARLGDDLRVSVRFGNVAEGSIPVRWTSTGYQTPPPDPNFPAWGIALHHPAFVQLAGIDPMLWIQVTDGIVSGAMGWRTQAALAADPQRFRGAIPRESLFGGMSGFTNVKLEGKIVNSLWKGRLTYDAPQVTFDMEDFHGTGHIRVVDESYAFDGGVDVPLSGLPAGARMPFKREAGGGFLSLVSGTKTWGFNRKVGASGHLSGSLIATLANGSMDVRGTGRYDWSDPKNRDRWISGTVTVVVASFPVAKEKVRDQLGADAPTTIDPATPGERIAITGWGQLDFALSDWLTGNAEVIVHPEGYVTARGEIVPTIAIPILKKHQTDIKIFPEASFTRVIPSLDALVADVALSVGVRGDGYASIGPGTFHNLRVSGLISTHPKIVNQFDISGTISTPAVAGVVVIAIGDIAARVWAGKFRKILKAGFTVKGEGALQIYGEAAARAGRRPAKNGEPEHFIQGHIEAAAALKLAVEIAFTMNVAFWSKHIPLSNRTLTIKGSGARLGFTYVFGKPRETTLSLSMIRGDFDESKYVDAVMRGETASEKYKGEQHADDEKLESEVDNPAAPEPVVPPDSASVPPASSHPGLRRTLTASFTMGGAPHELRLTLLETPILEMQSVLEPLIRKIGRTRALLEKERGLGAEDRKTRLAKLTIIEGAARTVQDAAMRAAKSPAYITPQVPGFKELASLIQDYGQSYGVMDLGLALDRVLVDPRQPQTVLRKFPGLASDDLMKGRVGRIVASGVDAAVLRKILDNVPASKEVEAATLLEMIETMIASGSPNWEDVIRDLAIGGNKFKGAEFVLRYVHTKLGWTDVSFEIGNDPTDRSGRRWDVLASGILYQFKSWYQWTGFGEITFLRQILEDYRRTAVGQDMPLLWIFETSMSRSDLVEKMKEALVQVVNDIRSGKEPKVPGYSPGIALFIRSRIASIVRTA